MGVGVTRPHSCCMCLCAQCGEKQIPSHSRSPPAPVTPAHQDAVLWANTEHGFNSVLPCFSFPLHSQAWSSAVSSSRRTSMASASQSVGTGLSWCRVCGQVSAAHVPLASLGQRRLRAAGAPLVCSDPMMGGKSVWSVG